jgi:hypothetical protein
MPPGVVVEVVSPSGADVAVVSVGGSVMVEATVVVVVVVVEGVVVEAVEVVVVVESVGPGDGVDGDVGVVGAGVGERGCVVGGYRSSNVTGLHIRAARAGGVGTATETRAPKRMSASTRAALSLPFMKGRLPNGPEVGNQAVLRYVGTP